MSSLVRLEQPSNKKDFLNPFWILENHTWFQTKISKVNTLVHTKMVQKPYPLGWHILALIGESPLTPIKSDCVGEKKIIFAITADNNFVVA